MKVISRNKVKDFLYHKVDGFIASQKGIDNLLKKGIITFEIYKEMSEKNLTRLQEKVIEWRVAEKMSCFFFAVLFAWFSISANKEDIVRNMNRSGRRTRKEQLIEK